MALLMSTSWLLMMHVQNLVEKLQSIFGADVQVGFVDKDHPVFEWN